MKLRALLRLTTVIASSLLIAGCGIVPSDPKISASAVRVDPTTVAFAVALCSGERSVPGFIDIGSRDHARTTNVRSGPDVGIVEVARQDLTREYVTPELKTEFEDHTGRSNFPDWHLRRVEKSHPGRWVDLSYRPVALDSLRAEEC